MKYLNEVVKTEHGYTRRKYALWDKLFGSDKPSTVIRDCILLVLGLVMFYGLIQL